MSTWFPTTTLLLTSFPFTAFTFANNFNVLVYIVEYDGACPSSDFPRGGPTRRLLLLLGVNFLCGILGVNFFLSAPLLSLFSLSSLGIKLWSLICLYLHLSPKGHLFTWNRKQIGVVVFDSIEWILMVLFMGAAPAEASSRVRTSLRGNCCSWQFKAVIRNASLGSLEISSYNIANIFFYLALCYHLCHSLFQWVSSDYALQIKSVSLDLFSIV